MAIVTLDYEEGYSASHDIITGWDYTRIALVEQIVSSTSADDLITQAEAALIAAPDSSVGSITGVVGKRGSKYRMGSGGGFGSAANDVYVFIKAFVPEIVSPTCVKFHIVYRGYPVLTYEIDGCVSQIESNIDIYKTVMSVSYTYPSDYVGSQNAGQQYVQGVLVPRDEPEPVFTVRFMVVPGNLSVYIRGQNFNLVNANATDLMTAIAAFGGTVNNANYSIGIITGTLHQWKIVSVRASSEDQGLTYHAAMSFQFRSLGWDKALTFINPDTGLPPADLVVSKVKVTDGLAFPEYSWLTTDGSQPDIGSTIAATADESTFPSFGDVTNATFPKVNN